MSQQAEQEVIAAMLMHPHLAKDCDLTAEEFQHDAYQTIYRSIRFMVSDNRDFDVITLQNDLDKGHPGEPYREIMAQVLERSVGSKNMFREYCGIIRKDYRLRQAAGIAQSLLYSIQENKDLGATDAAISQLMQLGSVGRKHDWTIRESLKNAIHLVEEAFNKDGLVGVETGLRPLNEATGGWHATDLIIIGARPAMGKTALMLNHANAADVPADAGRPQIRARRGSGRGCCRRCRVRRRWRGRRWR